MESALDVRARPCAELGRGALARVELLEAPGGLESLRLRFARKTMRKPLLVLLRQHAAVTQELVAMRTVSGSDGAHPGVAQLVGAAHDVDRVYLFMEAVLCAPSCSLTLRALVRAHAPLRISVAAHVARDLADAVAHVHARGVVHRDLKPENIALRDTGAPVLIDFGCASVPSPRDADVADSDRQGSRPQRTASLRGTLAYLAPEGLERRGTGPPLDCWALGVLIYELIAGVTPFAAETKAEVRANILDRHRPLEPPPRPPTASADDAERAVVALRSIRALLTHAEADRHDAFAARLATWLFCDCDGCAAAAAAAADPSGAVGGGHDCCCADRRWIGERVRELAVRDDTRPTDGPSGDDGCGDADGDEDEADADAARHWEEWEEEELAARADALWERTRMQWTGAFDAFGPLLEPPLLAEGLAGYCI